MHEADRELADSYQKVLQHHLDRVGEVPLHEAYDWGRRALTQGLGAVDIVGIHHESLVAILRHISVLEESARITHNAAAVQAESLSVFEMALLGYREANAQLIHLNKELKEKAAELERLAATEHQARLELEHAHQALKETQSQLVHSAKLASLGQMVAGVAHEINNPLAFVLNNLVVLQRDIQELLVPLHLYQEVTQVVAQYRPDLHQQMRDVAEQIDLPYILENLDPLLTRSQKGLKRIQQIVQDLRSFAHLDQGSAQEETDLNSGIASTLNIVRGLAEMQHVELEVDLAPLPPMICYPLKLNQVILNLGANAIEACSKGGKVTVRTRPIPEGVEIEVVDTGSGIVSEVRDQIFDPFFTTKPPGKGTGLGLSISHAIVEEHGGQIEVESTPGRGTTFLIRLPLRPPEPSAHPEP